MTDQEYMNFVQQKLQEILKNGHEDYFTIGFYNWRWNINTKNKGMLKKYKFSDLFPYLDIICIYDDGYISYTEDGAMFACWNIDEDIFYEIPFSKFQEFFRLVK